MAPRLKPSLFGNRYGWVEVALVVGMLAFLVFLVGVLPLALR